MSTTDTRVPSPELATAAEAPATNLPTAVEAASPASGQMLPPTTGFGNVVGAIASVMAELTPVEKGGKNQFHNYKYARMQDILQTLTPLMGKHGLAIFQYETDRQMFDDGKVLAIRYNFIVAHSSGEAWVHPVPQTGMSPCRTSEKTGRQFDDKSFAKAHTSARKYFLLSLFQIPTEDEADPDNEKRDRAAAPVPSPDGHVAPHLIEPQNRDTFDSWASRYLASARTAKAPNELDAWDAANDLPLSQMDNDPKGKPVYERILKEFEALRIKMQATPSPSKADQISTGISPEEKAARAAALSDARARASTDVPPADAGQSAPFVRPTGMPNAEMEPDAFVAWSFKRMDSISGGDELSLIFENEIGPGSDGLFKPDVDAIQAHYEACLAKLGD